MLPDFLHIGVAKGASTWLYQACLEHPDIYVPPNNDNLNFFLAHYHRGLAWYRKQYFAAASNERAVGDFSNSYLISEVVLERIVRDLPEVKLSVLLRNPVERAYLHWAHSFYKSYDKRTGFRPGESATDSGDPIDILPIRPAGRLFQLPLEIVMHPNGWTWCRYFLEPGLYAAHLSRFRRHFGADRLRIMLYDDLCAQPEAFIRDYYTWLGADADFEPPCLHHQVNPDNSEVDPNKLSSELREFMQKFYRSDIDALQHLLGRDLSHWQ